VILTRRAFNAALSTTALLAAAGVTPFSLIGEAHTQDANAADLATAHPLGDVVLGPANATVTIIEYASMSCGHCAEFHKTVYPKIKSEYIDTNKVRFIFREFPLDIKAAAGAMLARCIGKDDPNKYHAIIDTLFATQNDWVMQNTTEQLSRIGKQAGMSDQSFTECLSNQSMLDGIKKGQDFAYEKLKVDSTPTFFVNGTRLKGGSTFEDFDKLIKPNLKS
jgi:protein-disulfide isomerase